MLLQFFTDLNTVVGLCAALFAFDYLLTPSDKGRIANKIDELVKSARKLAEQFRDSTRAIGEVIELLLPSGKTGLYRVIAVSGIFIALSVLASYLMFPLWRVSIYMSLGDLPSLLALLISPILIVISVIASWWMCLYLLPVLREARSGFALPIFLIAAMCVALISYVAPRPFVYVLLRALPVGHTVIVPVQASFSDASDGTQTPISLNVTRHITPQERLFLQGLRYIKEEPIIGSGSKPGTYSFAIHETITTVKEEDLFIELNFKIGHDACGQQISLVVSKALGLSGKGVDAVGGGLLNCALLRRSSLVRRLDLVFRQPLEYSSISLGIGASVGPLAIRRTNSEGVAFIGDIYISHLLRGDPGVKTELDNVKKLFDKRGFDYILSTIAGAENVFVLAKAVIGFVPLLAVAILLSLAALKILVRIMSLTMFAWLLDRLQRGPCTVMAYLILIASAPFLLTKAMLVWL